MYIKTVTGVIISSKGLLDSFEPSTQKSTRWTYWKSMLDPRTCIHCLKQHGKIYRIGEPIFTLPPLHRSCRCEIVALESIFAGQASKEGTNGADWWLINYGILPGYYISEEELRDLGWKWGKKPSKYASGKMLTIGVFENEDGHLPDAPGRIWYEADLNYYSGYRNAHRILWSNDGLVFVTYNHYLTFYEVTTGGVSFAEP